MSTPPLGPGQHQATAGAGIASSGGSRADVTEAMLVKKMYDRYKVSMNGMQVILGERNVKGKNI